MRLKLLYLVLGLCLSFDLLSQPELQLPLRSIGPAGMSGRITSIAVSPSDKNVWHIGTASGGLWTTVNAGTTFEPVFDAQPVQSIGAVAVAPSNPKVIYVGTGEGNPRNSQSSGNGLYKSSDGGATWSYLGLPQSRNVHRLIVHPDNEEVVWAGVLGDPFNANGVRGLYKSVNGGETWRRILFSNDRSGVADLVMDPHNPDKLIASLWEFRRSPWDSSSGGPGSGLFMSEDGGENWQELGASRGLPAKPYGRIGVAIAASNSDRVYAIVESQKNAMYRSDDGGVSWEMINTETIGSRPFYFSEMHVDTQNPDRVYNLYSRLARSEDAGENFEVIEDWGMEVHADHHAFWIDPDDSRFIIDGTDGGLYWSRDRGENWRFAENLPLGQFYHITVDDAVPYRVYGGLQDNGTWYGPSEVWNRGGIRNSYWRELAFNDGFDVVLERKAGPWVYALWQGGMLVRINTDTGQRKTIMPTDDDETLRFNWNAAIAGDPFQDNTLYIGSQFVHKSIDRGESWLRISPDLTSNDPSKQQQHRSGGLSIDATAAESHTTITVIAASELEQGLLWVGSDDGRLHMTRDGGKSWRDLSDRLSGVPQAAWVKQIVPSSHDPSQAFVVVDNHLQGDSEPYILHTRDYGATWDNILSGQGIPSYALSFVQDPVEPRLMFAGTEYGLYVSLDAGASWQQWTNGYPSVSTMDLKIQKREGDLVAASFGRSVWVLDDLTPWRTLAASQGLKKYPLQLFAPPDTYQPVIDQALGQRLSPDHLFSGDNNARQALISFWLDDEAVESVEISVRREDRLVRQWEHAVVQGMNRASWDLQWSGVEIYGPLMSPVLEQPLAAPGVYEVSVSAGELVRSEELTVLADPRVDFDAKSFAENLSYRQSIEALQTQSKEVLRVLGCMEEQLAQAGDSLSGEEAEALQQEIIGVWERVAFREFQGVISDSNKLSHRLSKAFYFTHSPYEPLTSNDRQLLRALEHQSQAVLSAFSDLLTQQWGPKMGPLDAVMPDSEGTGSQETGGSAENPAGNQSAACKS
ncbi:WD40/YVTN/BNR-like repeat-containing protein [Congregibacter sp.]|uniref:WD40/YVTN/BNR-like repeat-containing protein n=1 Tax=Congregibacter sp. TaxID=2744308 RepID=UPI003F6AE74B